MCSSKILLYNKVTHKSQEELQEKLRDAARQVAVGKLYAHYKNPLQAYKVLHVALTESDDEGVLYTRRNMELG